MLTAFELFEGVDGSVVTILSDEQNIEGTPFLSIHDTITPSLGNVPSRAGHGGQGA